MVNIKTEAFQHATQAGRHTRSWFHMKQVYKPPRLTKGMKQQQGAEEVIYR